MTIREIKKDEKEVKLVVDIHLATFAGFFLTFMGRGFLNLMYKCYCEHEKSGILGAFDDDNRLMGFLAYSEDMSNLYRYMIKSKFLLFAWYSIIAFFKKPTIFARLLRAFLKPSETTRNEKYIELSSIGVRPDCKSKGVGTQLINYLKKSVDFKEYKYINLETDAVANEKANNFYRKNGFSLVRTFETAEQRKMNEYRYYQEDKVLI